jgi:hypothetical protein
MPRVKRVRKQARQEDIPYKVSAIWFGSERGTSREDSGTYKGGLMRNQMERSFKEKNDSHAGQRGLLRNGCCGSWVRGGERRFHFRGEVEGRQDGWITGRKYVLHGYGYGIGQTKNC